MDNPRPTERIVYLVERIAAIMLGVVTLLTFASAIGRYLFALPIPDAFDLSRLGLAVAIVWGFASLGFRGNHIKVDLLAQTVFPGLRRVLDFIAWTFLFIFTLALIWKIGGRVAAQFPGGEATMDLRIPHWPFLALLVAGLVMAAIMTLIRLWRVLKFGEGLEEHEALPREDRP